MNINAESSGHRDSYHTSRRKRVLDIAGSSLALTALSPLIMISPLVKLLGTGPIIFEHQRVGRGGEKFGCLKIRTMVVDADEVLQRMLATDPEAKITWNRERKLVKDPRVTSFGRILRKLSLDELPQVYNVLIGEMSLVGPRPVVEEELLSYGRSVRFYKMCKPGITGLWQVSGRSDISYFERVKLDRLYAQKASLKLDMLILVKTLPAVLKLRGAY